MPVHDTARSPGRGSVHVNESSCCATTVQPAVHAVGPGPGAPEAVTPARPKELTASTMHIITVDRWREPRPGGHGAIHRGSSSTDRAPTASGQSCGPINGHVHTPAQVNAALYNR